MNLQRLYKDNIYQNFDKFMRDRFIQRQHVRAWVCKHFLYKTSPQKLLTGFLPNFTGVFLR